MSTTTEAAATKVKISNIVGRLRRLENAKANEVPYQLERKAGTFHSLLDNDTLRWGGAPHYGTIVFRESSGWCVRTEHKGHTIHVELGSLIGRSVTRIGDVRSKRIGA